MKSEFLILFVAVVAVISGIFIVLELKRNKPLDIEALSVGDALVSKAFLNYAIGVTADEYRNLGKPIKTQKGEYRANFMNDANKKTARYMKDCLSGSRFSDDFCIFTRTHYSDARIRDLSDIIASFIETRKAGLEENFESFLRQTTAITPDEFFAIKAMQKGDVVGVYVIHNESKDMYYVGQAKRLFFRINQHFTGHGNGDVYADYKYGDDFSIKIVKLSDSGYADLDLLEKDLIEKYQAYDNGYNKTVGNKV